MSAAPDRRKRIQAWLRRAVRRLPILLVALAAIGFVVRVTVRDRFPVISIFYYALPLIVQAGLLYASAACWGYSKKWRRTLLCLIAANLLFGFWRISNSYEHRAQQTGGPRIVFWNIARGKLGMDSVIARIKRENPDVIALAEAGLIDNTDYWGLMFPGYSVSDCRGGLIIMARGTISGQQYERFDFARCLSVRIEAAGMTFRVAVADVMSNPFRSRRTPIEQIYQFVNGFSDAPVVVVGDFNTTADSVWFDNWREKMNHGFEQAGEGVLATWPNPVPVIAIDHVWVSRPLKCGSCRLLGTMLSDHRMVEFSLAQAQ